MEGARGPVDVRAGATVVAYNGETLGTVHTAYPHFFVLERGAGGESAATDYEVPMHAVVGVEGDRVLLRVNLEALTELPAERQSAAHRLHGEA